MSPLRRMTSRKNQDCNVAAFLADADEDSLPRQAPAPDDVRPTRMGSVHSSAAGCVLHRTLPSAMTGCAGEESDTAFRPLPAAALEAARSWRSPALEWGCCRICFVHPAAYRLASRAAATAASVSATRRCRPAAPPAPRPCHPSSLTAPEERNSARPSWPRRVRSGRFAQVLQREGS